MNHKHTQIRVLIPIPPQFYSAFFYHENVPFIADSGRLFRIFAPMENFVVSARKYRPATFDTVVGQSHITTTLKNAIRTNHLAQAFLFCGPRGVGKTTCARILAKTINCQNLDDSIEPCNACTSCTSFAQNASFTIHELDAASNNSVEDIRNLIDQVRFPPQDGKYKVYIIDEVHMLSQAAFNAFLKTLEEPPPYAIFILATTEKHKILPTILSRCQLFDFNRIQIRDMADHLASIAKKEGIEADYEALELIAQKADGGLRDALSMFDLNVTFAAGQDIRYEDVLKNLHILDYDYYFRLTDAIAQSNLPDALLLFDEVLQKGFDGHQFVVGLNEHFRNLLVAKDAQTVRLMEVSESVKERYNRQAGKLDTAYLMSCLSVGASIDSGYKVAKNQRLHVEIGLMKLSQIARVLQLSQLPASEEAEKKNLTETASPAKTVAPPTAATEQVAVAAPTPVPVASTSGNTNLTATVVTKRSGGATPSTLRRTATFEDALTPKEEATNLVAEPSQVALNQPFTEEALKMAVSSFIEKVTTDTAKLILKKSYGFDGTTLRYELDNQVQYDTFLGFKQDLASHVRQAIQNSSVQFEASVVVSQQARKAYTAQEKYDEMLKKNPLLQHLRQELDLDLLY